MPYIPHTEQDVQKMLTTLGIKNTDELFSEIPENLRIQGELPGIPEALSEIEVARLMKDLAAKDQAGLCFIGAGAYEHHIPAVVWEIAGRGEFMTAYTPYQAEASQGTLQVIYEYQTMITSLMHLDVANASMYDGASALAEAVLMAVRSNQNSQSRLVLIPRGLNPVYRQTIESIVYPHHLKLVELPFSLETGRIDMKALNVYQGQDIAALVLAQPNFFGTIEDVDALTDWAHAQKALVVASVNPTAMALLKAPGEWGQTGADIATGDGQPLGAPLASGGPYFGFMCCKKDFMRQMPGRIVGRTTDVDGKTGFVLTLQAREQHIRRAKATSNICSNQGLMATAATIYMSLLGAEGMLRIAESCHNNAKILSTKLGAVKGVKKLFGQPFFHEFVLSFEKPVTEILEKLAKAGIQGGYALSNDYPELGNCLLVCATETKTEEDLNAYAQKLADII
jgi:glycine dehydrogenase subunit 1